MADLTAEDLRCPQCGAGVRSGAPWCGQCYAGLLPGAPAPTVQPPPPPAAQRVVPPVRVDLSPDGPGRAGAADPRWPCGACGASNALDDAACATCGAGFLAGVRESEPPLLEVPGVGDLSALSRVQRLGLGAVLVLVVAVLTLLVGLLTS